LPYLPNFYGSPTLTISWNVTSCNVDSSTNFSKSGVIARVPVVSTFGQMQSYTEQNPMVYLLEEANITNFTILIRDEENTVNFENLPFTMEFATCLVRDLTKIPTNLAPGSIMNPMATVDQKMNSNVKIDPLTRQNVYYRDFDINKRMRTLI